MDSRSKHLSGENRGVILVEDLRGSSQRAIYSRLDQSASTICQDLGRILRMTVPVARNRHIWPRKLAGCDVGGHGN